MVDKTRERRTGREPSYSESHSSRTARRVGVGDVCLAGDRDLLEGGWNTRSDVNGPG